jgi:hypothetical protein
MDDRWLDVDQHGVLRIPGVMWLGLILLVRHWAWFFVVLLSAQYGGGAAETLQWQGMWWPLLAQLPVVALILVAGRRTPVAGILVRKLWRHGALLVAMTACLNLAWTIWSLAQANEWSPRPELVLACGSLLDLAIGWNLCLSEYTKQLFTEFPEQADA